MPREAPTYDLILLLLTSVEPDERAKILADVEAAISGGGGAIERNQDWGTRALTYEIDHHADAEYHLLQFSGPPSLLESLSHSLRIADGVLRFRIIKVIRGMPPAPDSAPPVIATVPAAPAAAAVPPASAASASPAAAAPAAAPAATEEAGA